MKMACGVLVLVLLGGTGFLAPRPALAHGGGENERKDDQEGCTHDEFSKEPK